MLPEAEAPRLAAGADSAPPIRLADLLRTTRALLLLAKPGIVLAELLAGLAGALLALPASPAAPLWLVLLCLAMAAGGAAMANGLLERGSDRKMARLTRRNRALEIAGNGLVLGMTMLLIGGALAIAAAFFNLLTLLLLAAAFSGYIFVYTGWLKRRTPWSVLAGGIPGALPPLIGAAAVSGSVPAATLLLGVLIYLWQLPHFLFLALQFRNQYGMAGIPVLPLVHGERPASILTLACALATVPGATAFSLAAGHPPSVTAALAGAASLFSLCCHHYLYRQVNYRRGFICSIGYLAITLLAVIATALGGPTP